jgi:hypothetical protein
MGTGTTVISRPTSDKNVREYHIVGQQICDLPYAEFSFPLWESEESFSDLGDMGEMIAQRLLDPSRAEEVERISFRPQSIRVSRNPNASWDKVERTVIIPALERALGVDQLKIKKYSDFKLRQLAHA